MNKLPEGQKPKTNISVRVDEQEIEYARHLGVNISEACRAGILNAIMEKECAPVEGLYLKIKKPQGKHDKPWG